MCIGGSKPSAPAAPVMIAPPPPPPAPAPTAQGMTVGSDRRQSAPLQQFLQNAISANIQRGTAALRTDLGGVSGGTGLNIPT